MNKNKLIDQVDDGFNYFNDRLEELKKDDVYYIEAFMKYIEVLESKLKRKMMNRIENLKEKIKSKFGYLDTIRKDKFTIQEEDGRFMFIPDSFEELAMDNDEEADSQGGSEILNQIEKAINYG